MKPLLRRICWGSAILSLTANAAILREDINVQDYRDFGENLGKYRPGMSNIPVYRKEGTLSGRLAFSMPDISMVNNAGYATLISPSYVTGVRHNGGYKTVKWGNNAKYAATYHLIKRNDHPVIDFHVPRLNKVVTDVAPITYISASDIANEQDKSRFPWFVRVGAGKHGQISEDRSELLPLAGAYKWKAGGTISADGVNINSMLRWSNWLPESPFDTPLSLGTQGGDSGSPIFVYDNQDKQWKLAAVHVSSNVSGLYERKFSASLMQDALINSVIAANSDPDVTDNHQEGNIHWRSAAIIQGANEWRWHGLDDSYASLAPSAASNEALDATKDLRFNGEGGTLILDHAINMGAGKLAFAADYLLRSADGENATWAGGGVEVEKDRSVRWQVNGLEGDALHKIGAGTLLINASGINKGALNLGDGTVILDQQADEHGAKQAFSSVTLVSGRATLRLNSADQLRSDQIQFGYRGGTLDLNGNDITFGEIKHNDDGARIVNHHASQQATVTLTSNQYAFLGKLGDKASADRLNLTFQPDNAIISRQLAGGAEVNHLSVKAGTLSLTGQRVLHAGNVYYSNDWDEKLYRASTLSIAPDAALTLGEHGNLTTNATLTGNARLNLYARSVLNGSVTLTDSDSVLYADISQRASTAGELASRIDADISGKGSLAKRGEGRLTLNGKVVAAGGITLDQGELVVNNSVSSPLQMAENTLLAGKGTLERVIMNRGATLFPARAQPEDKIGSTLRIKNLISNGDNTLVLNTRFSDGLTDRLLIDGDLQSTDDRPLMVSVNPHGHWSDSDLNHNGIADNHEGISLIQVGGKASANSVKLAGNYVARGAWAWGLYAFAPGKANHDARLLEGSGDRFWDYRLQNIMLSENGNAIPAPPPPAPEVKPEPVPDPEIKPELQPDPDAGFQPQPTPETPVRPAVIPQVPAYISLSTAFLSFEENMLSLFKTHERDGSPFFVSGYKGSDRYHTAEDFRHYGYNFHSQYSGWMMGTRRTLVNTAQQIATLGLGVAWGELSMQPQARDGVSSSRFDTLNLSSLLTWQHGNGIRLSAPLGYTHFRGEVSTAMRGHVASPTAYSWHAGLEAEKNWQVGNHRFGPVAGLLYQHLHIHRLQDSDNASVTWQMQRTPLYSLGAAWRYQGYPSLVKQLNLGGSLRYIQRASHANQTRIGHGADGAAFRSGQGGNSLQLAAEMALKVTNNVKLTTQLQHQRRTEKEGINDWGMTGGMTVTF